MAKRKPNPKKKPKFSVFAIALDTILIIVGFYLILIDAIPSILFQLDDPFLFQIGRAIRLAIGILLIFIGVIALRHNLFLKGKKK